MILRNDYDKYRCSRSITFRSAVSSGRILLGIHLVLDPYQKHRSLCFISLQRRMRDINQRQKTVLGGQCLHQKKDRWSVKKIWRSEILFYHPAIRLKPIPPFLHSMLSLAQASKTYLQLCHHRRHRPASSIDCFSTKLYTPILRIWELKHPRFSVTIHSKKIGRPELH